MLGLVLWAYFELVAHLLAPGLYHFVAPPLAIGLLAYWLLTIHNALGGWLIWLSFLIPLVLILIIGGDPAKPGLERLFYPPMVAAIFIGEMTAWAVHTVYTHKGEIMKPNMRMHADGALDPI